MLAFRIDRTANPKPVTPSTSTVAVVRHLLQQVRSGYIVTSPSGTLVFGGGSSLWLLPEHRYDGYSAWYWDATRDQLTPPVCSLLPDDEVVPQPERLLYRAQDIGYYSDLDGFVPVRRCKDGYVLVYERERLPERIELSTLDRWVEQRLDSYYPMVPDSELYQAGRYRVLSLKWRGQRILHYFRAPGSVLTHLRSLLKLTGSVWQSVTPYYDFRDPNEHERFVQAVNRLYPRYQLGLLVTSPKHKLLQRVWGGERSLLPESAFTYSNSLDCLGVYPAPDGSNGRLGWARWSKQRRAEWRGSVIPLKHFVRLFRCYNFDRGGGLSHLAYQLMLDVPGSVAYVAPVSIKLHTVAYRTDPQGDSLVVRPNNSPVELPELKVEAALVESPRHGKAYIPLTVGFHPSSPFNLYGGGIPDELLD